MNYVHPEVLVDTFDLFQNISNDTKIIEIDYAPENAYHVGHIDGAILMSWGQDIMDMSSRNIVDEKQFEKLMSKNGITPNSEIILYGDYDCWFAAFGFWLFKYYGHKNVKILNGGRKKWELEKNEYVTNSPKTIQTDYKISKTNTIFRAYYLDVNNALQNDDAILLDTRTIQEFVGDITSPPEFPNEQAAVGGHIPGAKNISWNDTLNSDGTFKDFEKLKKLYETNGITSNKNIICYCRIGERSAHSWVVLKYLLGFSHVRNYDGSWKEWGNMIGNPIEK